MCDLGWACLASVGPERALRHIRCAAEAAAAVIGWNIPRAAFTRARRSACTSLTLACVALVRRPRGARAARERLFEPPLERHASGSNVSRSERCDGSGVSLLGGLALYGALVDKVRPEVRGRCRSRLRPSMVGRSSDLEDLSFSLLAPRGSCADQAELGQISPRPPDTSSSAKTKPEGELWPISMPRAPVDFARAAGHGSWAISRVLPGRGHGRSRGSTSDREWADIPDVSKLYAGAQYTMRGSSFPFPRLHFFMAGSAPLTARGSQQ